MLNCTLLDDYQNVALSLADWASLQPAVQTRSLHQPVADDDALIAALADSDIIVAMRERTPLTAARLARLPRLKLIVTSGMRNAAIDLDACRARGIAVCGTESSSAPPLELTWGLLLALARHIVPENQALRSGGPWQQHLGIGLEGKTLGLIGLGKIGGGMTKVAQAFGMRVCAWSQHLTAERAAACGATLMPSLPALLAASDIVSLHLVLSAHASSARRRRAGADEARRTAGKHRARGPGGSTGDARRPAHRPAGGCRAGCVRG